MRKCYPFISLQLLKMATQKGVLAERQINWRFVNPFFQPTHKTKHLIHFEKKQKCKIFSSVGLCNERNKYICNHKKTAFLIHLNGNIFRNPYLYFSSFLIELLFTLNKIFTIIKLFSFVRHYKTSRHYTYTM